MESARDNFILPDTAEFDHESTNFVNTPAIAAQSWPEMESQTDMPTWTSNDYRAKWKNIEVDNTEYIISVTRERDVWKVSFSNLVEIWTETLTKTVALERCQKLNPLLDTDSFDISPTLEDMLNNIPKYVIGMSINQMKLQTILEGVAFKFNLNFTKGSPQQFWEEVTKPLCQSSMELQRRHDFLLDLVKKKDEEIAEYKIGGAQLIRRNIETVTFHDDLLRTEVSLHTDSNCINTFQCMMDLYNEMKLYDESIKKENETPLQTFREVNVAEPPISIKVEQIEIVHHDLGENETNCKQRYAAKTEVVNDAVTDFVRQNDTKEQDDCRISIKSESRPSTSDVTSDHASCGTKSKNIGDPSTSSEIPLKRCKKTVTSYYKTCKNISDEEPERAYFSIPQDPHLRDLLVRKSERGEREEIITKCTWTPKQLKAAMKAVHDGKPMRKVSREFQLPLASLKAEECFEATVGRWSIFTKDQEAELADILLQLSNTFYGLPCTELCRNVYEYAEMNKVLHTFDKEAKSAGEDWLYSFIQRHPDLRCRRPEVPSSSKIVSIHEVNFFYENLGYMYDKYKFTPSRIFTVHAARLAETCDPDRSLTFCCCICADGNYIPPLFIFQRNENAMMPALEKNCPPGSIHACSPDGSMNREIFERWLTHFIKHSRNPSRTNRVLLVVDNHPGYRSLFIQNFCQEHGIILLSIPPYTTRKLHPLEISFFEPLKTTYNRVCDTFMEVHGKIGSFDISSLATEAYYSIANMSRSLKGFKATGIFPLSTFEIDEYVL